jgi:hypothetical protein
MLWNAPSVAAMGATSKTFAVFAKDHRTRGRVPCSAAVVWSWCSAHTSRAGSIMHRGRGRDDGVGNNPNNAGRESREKGMIEMRILREWSTTRSITAAVLAATGLVAILQAARMIGTLIPSPGSRVQDGGAPLSTHVGPTGYRGKHRRSRSRRRPKPNKETR